MSSKGSSHVFRDGSTVGGRPEYVAQAAAIERDMVAQEAAWIDQLRAQGVRATHPDDGWVDRQHNLLRFCYPQFYSATLAVGDLVALGWPDKWRLVRLTAVDGPSPLWVTRSITAWRWHFEEADA